MGIRLVTYLSIFAENTLEIRWILIVDPVRAGELGAIIVACPHLLRTVQDDTVSAWYTAPSRYYWKPLSLWWIRGESATYRCCCLNIFNIENFVESLILKISQSNHVNLWWHLCSGYVIKLSKLWRSNLFRTKWCVPSSEMTLKIWFRKYSREALPKHAEDRYNLNTRGVHFWIQHILPLWNPRDFQKFFQTWTKYIYSGLSLLGEKENNNKRLFSNRINIVKS